MSDKFTLKALITAVDKLSPVLEGQMKVMNKWKRTLNQAGKGAPMMGAGLVAALALPAKAFADLETGATQLKNTLMDSNGVANGFDKINKIAIDLGTRLPGTTNDMYAMASQLKALGIDVDTIANGALKATAYLAVVGKPLGVTYESAAEAVGKTGKAFGIAAKDLVPFADTLQRALHLGVNLSEIQFAMAKIAPRLKSMGVQGLGVANDLVPLVSMLTSMGMSGETAGTGIEKMILGASKAGKFTGVKALVADLEKAGKLSASGRFDKFKKLFGEEGERAASVIAAGGYDKMVKAMQKQADLQMRVNNSLGTLTNLWESATTTFTNALAAIGEIYAPEVKQLAEAFNGLSEKLLDWAKANGSIIRTVIELAGAFVGLKLAFYAMGKALVFITGLSKANPWMLLIQGLVLAGVLIYENWDSISRFLGDGFAALAKTWDSVVKTVGDVWDGVMGRIGSAWSKFVSFIQPGIDVLKYLFEGLANIIGKIKFPDFKLPNLSGIGDFFTAKPNGMRPPGYNQKQVLQSQRVAGNIDVNFNNAPQGTRVVQGPARGPVAATPNVGYRSLGMGLP